MITIGIDPGIELTGVGIVEKNETGLKLIFKELIKTSRNDTTGLRLRAIYERLIGILGKFEIDHAAVEKLFFAKNVKTALTVSEVRGVILLAISEYDIPIYEYTPLQVKQALVGYGRGKKLQVQEMVKLILKLDEIPQPDDVADGIALAITHINTYRTLSRIKDNSTSGNKSKNNGHENDYLDFRR
jgi:crossover junction endodeoxyribonuclease RuvC